MPVAVQGTGVVDALVLSGQTEFRWKPRPTMSGGVKIQGELEAIIEGKTRPASSVQIPGNCTFQGEIEHAVQLNGPLYLMTIGGLKRYYRQQFPLAQGAININSWDEAMAKLSEGRSLMMRWGSFWSTGEGFSYRTSDNRSLTELLGPAAKYWGLPENELLLLRGIGRLMVIPEPGIRPKLRFNGEFRAPSPAYASVDGQYIQAESLAVSGTGTAQLRCQIPPTINPPVQIRAEYAEIGTGQLNLSRLEEDGRTMTINGLHKEDLENAVITADANEGSSSLKSRLAYAAHKILTGTTKHEVASYLAAACALWIIAPLIGEPLIFVEAEASLAAVILALQAAKPAYRNLRLEAMPPKDQWEGLALTFSGTQASKWVEQFPIYLDPGLRR
ncbi:hypothetical protein HYY74_03420 [Candidatus Woesearchaeota archaeon]|nr:hypothetical protein [Candidatus Woesearchaeota archaeon]